MQMAPNSHFSYPISLEGQKLEAGTYLLKSVAYSGKAMKDSIKSRMVMRKKDIYTDGNLKKSLQWLAMLRETSIGKMSLSKKIIRGNIY